MFTSSWWKYFLLLLYAAGTASGRAAPPTRPAAGDPLAADAIVEVMRRAADYQLEAQAKTKHNHGWIRAAFYTGVMALYETTQDEKYLQAAMKWAEEAKWQPEPREKNWRHADDHAAGQTYTELYFIRKDPAMIAPIRDVFDRLMADPKRGREDWWWCDALFMAPPVLARLAEATGDQRYLKFLDEMWWDTTEFLYDKDEHLYYRDKNFFPPKQTKNGKKIFWSRGNGWVMAGTVRVLQYLPEDWPTRQKYIDLHKEMAAAIIKLQRPDGTWPPSLLDNAEIDTPETSGTGFYTYALAWGINNGHLDRETYLPVVQKSWKALVGHVNDQGRLGYVQPVAAAPDRVKPESTHEYGVGAFLLAGSEMIKLAPRGAGAAPTSLRIDFGGGPVEKGFKAVGVDEIYNAGRGYGWANTADAVLRDRRAPDALRRDYVFGKAPASFRIDAAPGAYRLTLITGDMEYGDHILTPSVNAGGVTFAPVQPDAGEFATITAAFDVKQSPLVVTFDSPKNNWVINGLVLEPAEKSGRAGVAVDLKSFAGKDDAKRKYRDRWRDVSAEPDPTAPLLEQFRKDAASAPAIEPTGLSRGDYLKLIAGNVDFFEQQQDESGAIIDPYRKVEFQYSTPCFAGAAAALVAHAGRHDLIEPAAKAMDWACSQLKQRKAASGHEDFYPPPIAHALPLLKPHVSAQRYAKWIEDLRSFDPYKVYRYPPGANNWNMVAASGEYLFHKLGIRGDLGYVEDSVSAQGHHFDYPYGLYTEGPMAYDHFPRLWAADMIAHGYDGQNAENLTESLRRAAVTSLFMQSPTGELPTGGRSAHHQWNEAQQCVTYEIFAARAQADGDAELAGAYKRAAHLALGSMLRWIRPSGEMWIVKNRVDPKHTHGYESYSSHSQYNLLPMAMLAIAYEHAEASEDVKETPSPADVGGFVIDIRPVFHRIIANAGGMYVQIDVGAEPGHNATGLLRIHKRGHNPQLGPSESLIARGEEYPADAPRTNAAVGVAWRDVNGQWRRLADYQRGDISAAEPSNVETSPDHVGLKIAYRGYFSGPDAVIEDYVVTPDEVQVTYSLPGYDGPMRIVWPVLDDIGDARTSIAAEGETVRVTLAGDMQTFTAQGAASVSVEETRYPFRNGWAKLAVAEYPAAAPATLIIKPSTAKQE
jgi:rhamnogalacturonyl hydrolase YesR